MAKVLVFQHVPYEPLGLLDPLIRAGKHRIRYVNFSRPQPRTLNIEAYDALIILGGPMNVDQADIYPHLVQEQDYIRRAAAAGIPILGICLGAQLIAAAFGGEVFPAAQSEVGWCPVQLTAAGGEDPVLQPLAQLSKVFQWHGHTFSLPPQAESLVRGEVCAEQGFRIGSNIYGFQFHLEANLPLIQRWLRLPQHKAELAAFGSSSTAYAEQVWRDTLYQFDNAQHVAVQVFSRFLRHIPAVNRVVQLKHR
ncbi:MAG: gamma-glutamyl-gamma-aminobutyrate hydrolase family protein [Gammaproteobacteria bacterium]|nr:gamma-glutamyl-gamma-aminobutyrate hydrolase family protein [Gammaproteobacteria bacterium]